MNRTTPEKRHALNKRVRKEKARLRKRSKKRRSRYEKLVTYNIELSPETMAKVEAEAKRTHTSRQKVVRKAIRRAMEEYENGVQKESDIKVDESSK